jgi:hypothetical protein
VIAVLALCGVACFDQVSKRVYGRPDINKRSSVLERVNPSLLETQAESLLQEVESGELTLDAGNRLPSSTWPSAIAALRPEYAELEGRVLWLHWADHIGAHGIRVFPASVTSNTAHEASSFVRTFEVKKLSGRVWFYVGD